jgi:TnpA family transposase
MARGWSLRMAAPGDRTEDRHKLVRAVFHGKRGELRQRYREGQEDQLGALGLVVNIIVLWNTLYMDAAVEQLRRVSPCGRKMLSGCHRWFSSTSIC